MGGTSRHYYHVTPLSNLKGILDLGLKSRGGGGFYPEGGHSRKLFLFEDEGDAFNFLEEGSVEYELMTGKSGSKWALLRVKLPSGLKVYEDPDMPSIRARGYYVLGNIPPTNIEVVGTGSVDEVSSPWIKEG